MKKENTRSSRIIGRWIARAANSRPASWRAAAAEDGAALRRRRECSACGHRFTTFERRERPPLRVRKRDGERQRFDRTKLRAALLRSTHKRQVSAADVEALVEQVALAIETARRRARRRSGSASSASQGLRELDRGAYLQFLGTLPTPNAGFCGVGATTGSVRAPRESASLPAQAG